MARANASKRAFDGPRDRNTGGPCRSTRAAMTRSRAARSAAASARSRRVAMSDRDDGRLPDRALAHVHGLHDVALLRRRDGLHALGDVAEQVVVLVEPP